MDPRSGIRSAARLSMVAALVLACGATPDASPTPPPPGPFSLDVQPAAFIGMTMSGSHAVFLVTVSGSASDGPVTIHAIAPGAAVKVDPEQLEPGVVGEVAVTPATVASETEIEVVFTATRAGVEQREIRTITAIAGGEDTLRPEADARLAPFLAWLATEHPELGIDAATVWDGTRGSWVLIVEHYLYFSEDWELDLEWHVMVPPSDWARIYLRERRVATRPSLAYEIESVASGLPPREIAPPEAVWR